MTLDRRGWILAAGVAATAAVAGIGWSVWRHRARPTGLEGEIWQASFDTPQGTRLALADLRGHPLVLNFWATWCPPCIREMPALDRFARDFHARGWRVVGLAVDTVQPVREFLARTPVSYAIGLTGFKGIELARQLGNTSGGLPFTLVLGGDGALLQRRLGETNYDELSQWARGVD